MFISKLYFLLSFSFVCLLNYSFLYLFILKLIPGECYTMYFDRIHPNLSQIQAPFATPPAVCPLLFMHIFSLNPSSLMHRPYNLGQVAIHWSTVDLPGVTPLWKTDFPSHSSDQLTVASQLEVGFGPHLSSPFVQLELVQVLCMLSQLL